MFKISIKSSCFLVILALSLTIFIQQIVLCRNDGEGMEETIERDKKKIVERYYEFISYLEKGEIQKAMELCDHEKVKIVSDDNVNDTVPYINIKIIKQNKKLNKLYSISPVDIEGNKTSYLVRSYLGYYYFSDINCEWKIVKAGLKPIE